MNTINEPVALRVKQPGDYILPGYIDCALWSSTDDDGQPMDEVGAEIHPTASQKMLEDCNAFMQSIEHIDTSDWSLDQIGHDFWLTHNRHGTGFWDRGYGSKESRDELTTIAHTYGSCDLYVGDDGFIYCC